jgi:hypothetical protein
MSDFGHFGGSEEEYATVRKHTADVVRETKRCTRPRKATSS